MDSPRRSGAAAAALLGFVVLALFSDVVIGGESFFGRDATPYFYPMKRYLADALSAGRFPLWNPLVAGGEPFFAALQPGVLYPGSLVLLALPFPASVDWLIVLHYLFAGAGWVLVLREERLPTSAALFGALAFVLGGFFVSLGNFVNNLQAMSWAPWLLLAWTRYLRAGTAGRLLVFSAVCVVAFLAGEPQLLALTLALTALYGALHGGGRMGIGRQALSFVGAGALALLAAGVQLVPFLEYLGASVRTLPLGIEFSARLSQEPGGLLHLALPPAYGADDLGFTTRHLASARAPWLLSLYPGVIVAGFWLAGLATERRAAALAWGGLAVAGLVLAFGAYTPVFPILFELVPPLRAVRYPEKFAALAAIGVPLLAGRGFARWLAGRPGAARRVFAVLVAATLVYGLTALILAVRPGAVAALCDGAIPGARLCGDPGTASAVYAGVAGRLAVLAGAGAALVAVVRSARMAPATAAWAVLALAAVDLVVAHADVNPTVERTVYTGVPWVAEVLSPRMTGDPVYRFRGTPAAARMGSTARVPGAADLSNLFLDRQALGPNAGQSYGIPQQDGLQGVELRSAALLQSAAPGTAGPAPVRFLRMANVRYYADPTARADSLPGLVEIAHHPELPIRVWEVPDPLPRAYVAAGWETAAGPVEALARTIAPRRPERRVVLERAPRSARRGDAEPPGRIVAATWRSERVRLITRSRGPAVVVLLDTWYPGWEATVNGQPVEILRAGGVYRAVEVPAGEADVEFTYRPRSLRLGAASTVTGLLAGFLLALLSRRRRA